jgi:hypothetical protein
LSLSRERDGGEGSDANDVGSDEHQHDKNEANDQFDHVEGVLDSQDVT